MIQMNKFINNINDINNININEIDIINNNNINNNNNLNNTNNNEIDDNKMFKLIQNCLEGKITVYEYMIKSSNLKLSNNVTLLSSNDTYVVIESNIDYSHMTDEEIDEYDNKLYLSVPHDTILIKSVNTDEIIEKINNCNTILFVLVNDYYDCNILIKKENDNYDKNILLKKSLIDVNLKLYTTENLDLFDIDNFIILTWTNFHKYLDQ